MTGENRVPGIEHKDRTALYGCLGTVLAALISGTFLLISSGSLRFDMGTLKIGSASNSPVPVATQSSDQALNILPTDIVLSPSPLTPNPQPASPTVLATLPASSPTPVPKGTPVHVVGQAWEQDGVSLVATNIVINTDRDGPAAVQVFYRLLNKTGQTLVVSLDWSVMRVVDDVGNRYVDWQGGSAESRSIQPEENYVFVRNYSLKEHETSRVPANATYVQVIVDRLSRVQSATWQFNINQPLSPIATPEPAAVKQVGDSWEEGGLTLTVKDVTVQDEHQGPAALEVSYSLANQSGQRRRISFDTSYLYMLDSLGQRYNDWQAGEVMTQWVETNSPLEFQRYYSLVEHQSSRVPPNADFILVKVEQLGPFKDKSWRFDIAH